MTSSYAFCLNTTWSPTCTDPSDVKIFGLMPQFVVDKMPWLSRKSSSHFFHIDHKDKVISIPYQDGITESEILAAQLKHAREQGTFELLKGWRDELYPVRGVEGREVVMERSASALFGIETWGMHLNAYSWVPTMPDPAVRVPDGQMKELKLWVPRRSPTKSTYPSMLDNSVAGGIPAGESPYTCLLRESLEEASLPNALVSSRAKSVGTVSYVHVRDKRAGGETGLINPEVQFCYDLELDPPDEGENGGHVPRPGDDEVESFTLMSVKEVREELAKGAFKPNCALIVVDFLIRWGLIGLSDEGLVQESGERTMAEKERRRETAYREIVARLHGRTDVLMELGSLRQSKI